MARVDGVLIIVLLIQKKLAMKKIITLILFVFVVQAAFTQSAYQTKCHQIFIKYLKMFTQGTGITMNAGDEIA